MFLVINRLPMEVCLPDFAKPCHKTTINIVPVTRWWIARESELLTIQIFACLSTKYSALFSTLFLTSQLIFLTVWQFSAQQHFHYLSNHYLLMYLTLTCLAQSECGKWCVICCTPKDLVLFLSKLHVSFSISGLASQNNSCSFRDVICLVYKFWSDLQFTFHLLSPDLPN